MRAQADAVLRALAGVGLLAAAAAGQVVQTQSGHALDANPQVGSYGLNTASPLGTNLNSQLYVTGQVSGLARFQGNVPYRAPDQLNLSIPGQAIIDFRRSSVGLAEVLEGQPYLVSPYQDARNTVLGLGDILRNRNIPGSPVPRSTYPGAETSAGQRLYIDALADYRSVLSPQAELAGLPRAGYPTATTVTGGIAPELPVIAPPGYPPPLSSTSGLFFLGRTRSQVELMKELYNYRQAEAPVSGRVRAGRTGEVPGGARQGTAVPPQAVPGATEPMTKAEWTPGGPINPLAGTEPLNQDVFLDMLLRLRQRRQQGLETPEAPGATAGAPGLPGLPTTTQPAAPPRTPLGVGKSLVQLTEDNQVVLHGLAGGGSDTFNRQMARAGDELQERNYYQAASAYRLAGQVDPQNPLPQVGRGLSLLGAGEPLSAAYELREALGRFPPLMETRIDLPSLLDRQIIEQQLNALDERLSTANEDARRMLTFLATFLYYNAKEQTQAKTYAERLKAASANDALLRAYADYVLSGQRPDEELGPPGKGKGPADLGTKPAAEDKGPSGKAREPRPIAPVRPVPTSQPLEIQPGQGEEKPDTVPLR